MCICKVCSVTIHSLIWHQNMMCAIDPPDPASAHTSPRVWMLCVRQLKWPKFWRLLGFWKAIILLSLSIFFLCLAILPFSLSLTRSWCRSPALSHWKKNNVFFKCENKPSETPWNNSSAAESWLYFEKMPFFEEMGNLELLSFFPPVRLRSFACQWRKGVLHNLNGISLLYTRTKC